VPGGTFITYGQIRADVKADEFGVYVASTDSKVYCVDRNNSKIKWQYFAGAALQDSPVVTKDRVYQAIPGRGVAAINKTEQKNNTQPQWQYNREALWVVENALQFLADDDKYAYLRGRDNTIIAVDRATGEVTFESTRSDFDVFGSNDKSDGIIYASTSRGQVMAIKPVLRPGSVGEIVLETRRVYEATAMAE
jgi:outer membrane protein assembly factor BamB